MTLIQEEKKLYQFLLHLIFGTCRSGNFVWFLYLWAPLQTAFFIITIKKGSFFLECTPKETSTKGFWKFPYKKILNYTILSYKT